MFGIGYLKRIQKVIGEDQKVIRSELDEIYENNKAKSNNIQKLYYNQTYKETFYNQVKNRNAIELDQE